MGIGNDERVGLELLDLGAHALELVGGRFAGKLQVMRHHRAVGRRRAVAPDRIDRDWARSRPGWRRRWRTPWRGARRPRRCAARRHSRASGPREVRLDPRARRLVDEVLDGKQRAVDLVARLGGVAAVDEQRGAVGEDDRGAGRSGEAGEPGEALLAGGQIFVLKAVGMGHDEAVEPAPRQLRAQRRDARRRLRRFRRIVEGLELRLELAGRRFRSWG